MSFLYTINGLYPDRNFAFTLTAAGLGIAPQEHIHSINDILELPKSLDSKSEGGHTHAALPAINAGSMRLTGSITLAVSGGGSIQKSGNTVMVGVASEATGTTGGFLNANPARRHSLLLFFVGDKRSATGDAEYFIFKED